MFDYNLILKYKLHIYFDHKYQYRVKLLALQNYHLLLKS